MGEVNVVIDGIFCNKCNVMHPTLYWHEKYNDYLPKRKEKHAMLAEKYGVTTHYLSALGLMEATTEVECVICGAPTNYKSVDNNGYVCCDECRYKNKNP